MRAGAGDAAILQHDDLIGKAHGGRALGDDERRRTMIHGADGAAESGVGCIVERGGAVVKNQDVRLFDEGARDGQALALAAGEVAAALLDRLVKPEGLAGDDVERLSDGERFIQLFFRGIGIAPEEV